jgi:hypothetical protein
VAVRLGLLVLAACGRVGFDPHGVGDGASEGSGGEAVFGTANLVFVTSGEATGNIGGLAGADQRCNDAATAANQPGHYVAWLSAAGTAARDRLAGASGWVRVDGVPVASSVAEWLDGNRIFNPIAADEHGDAVTPSIIVWTGTNPTGMGGLLNCQDWATAMPNQSGVAGSASGAVGDQAEYSIPSCNSSAHLYCFQIDHTAGVGPAPVAGRIAFITKTTRPGGSTGITGMDQSCGMEATAAGLTGTFLAAVATTTTTIASRFADDARPWVRVDGTVIAPTTGALFSGPLRSFVNQDAAGNYISATTFIWTGATSPTSLGVATCNDWASVAASATANTGRPGDADVAVLWNQGTAGSCNQAGRLLCLEK